MVLSSGDPMEEVNKFMRDGILTKEGDFVDGVEDSRCFKDGSIE